MLKLSPQRIAELDQICAAYDETLTEVIKATREATADKTMTREEVTAVIVYAIDCGARGDVTKAAGVAAAAIVRLVELLEEADDNL